MNDKNRILFKPLNITVLMAIVIVVLFSYLLYGGLTGESWGYWFFSKNIIENGSFINAGRAPIYTLYLVPFSLLSYPLSIEIEYLVTAILTLFSLYLFLQKTLGTTNAILFSAAWIPFIQLSQPYTQALGLACICMAFFLRSSPITLTSHKISFSYTFLILAMLLRPNFSIFIILVIVYDYYQIQRRNGREVALFKVVKPFLSKSCLIVISLAVVFIILPSTHRWNNAWMATNDWFPTSESLSTTSIIGHYNWRYIEKKYGSYEGRDIYFTHDEAFSGALTVFGMIKSNPRLFTEIVLKHAKAFIVIATFGFPLPILDNIFYKLIAVTMFVLLVFGALRATNDRLIWGFVIASLISAFAATISYPKTRYMYPLIPVIALSAWWYGSQLQSLVMRINSSRLTTHIAKCIIPATLIFFSWTPSSGWAKLSENIHKDGNVNTVTVDVRNTSMKAAYQDLLIHSMDCKGIMTYEHNYFAAFLVDSKSSTVYDIWEIPPFGDFSNSIYKGLVPNRIDCIFISYSLEQEIGMGTNARLRFDNYIKPYESYLIDHGARIYDIPSYGRVVKLSGDAND